MQKGIFILFLTIIYISCHTAKDANLSMDNQKSVVNQKPNVVFILVDDLGWKDLGYSGSQYYETPNIDALAKKGMVFTQGYAASRVCSPSRASIMTGKFTARHGITDWIGAKTGEDWRSMNRHDKMLPAEYVTELANQDLTMAEVMRDNGYKTFFAGKWHLGGDGSSPEDHGFEINKGGTHNGSPPGGYFSPFQNPKLDDHFNGENLSMRLAKETVSFINQEKSKPFFAFLSFYAVHGPIQTTEEKWNKYQQKATAQGINQNGFKMESKLPIRQHQDNPVYAGLVESMDDAVGEVINGLKAAGLDQKTIVIFTSDNGGVSSGDAFSTSNLPYRGGKGYQWEGGIREPYIIYVPWVKTNGNSNDSPVTGADFFPTILDFANIPLLPKQHVDGASLKSLIERNSKLAERALYWHYPHYGNQGGDPSSIIRKGDYKLIHYYENGKNELYNLKSDPYEKNNLVDQQSALATELYDSLSKWLTSVDAKYPIIDKEYNDQKRQEYEKSVIEKIWPKLENERKLMLSKDFKPNKDWWGSKVTKD